MGEKKNILGVLALRALASCYPSVPLPTYSIMSRRIHLVLSSVAPPRVPSSLFFFTTVIIIINYSLNNRQWWVTSIA